MKGLFNNKKIIISGVLLLLILVVGVTYAIVVWTTTDYDVTLSTSCFDVNYKLGKDITAVLDPTDTEGVVYEPDNIISINEDMAVSDVSLSFKPECNRYEGMASIILNITSIDNAFTENGNSTGSLQYYLIPYDSSEYPNVDIEHLSGRDGFNYIAYGTIESTGSKEIYTTRLKPGQTKEYMIVFLIDNRLIDADVMGASFSASLDSSVEQVIGERVTPITDFLYVKGDDNFTSLALNVYRGCVNDNGDFANKEIVDYEVGELLREELPSDTILLTGYVGDSNEVVIPDTYTIDGVTYNVMILSNLYPFNSYLSYGNIGYSVSWLCDNYGSLSDIKYLESVSIGDNVTSINIYDVETDTETGTQKLLYDDSFSSTFYHDIFLTNINNLPNTNKFNSLFDAVFNLEGTIRLKSCDVDVGNLGLSSSKDITLEVPAHSYTADSAYSYADEYVNVTIVEFENSYCSYQ